MHSLFFFCSHRCLYQIHLETEQPQLGATGEREKRDSKPRCRPFSSRCSAVARWIRRRLPLRFRLRLTISSSFSLRFISPILPIAVGDELVDYQGGQSLHLIPSIDCIPLDSLFPLQPRNPSSPLPELQIRSIRCRKRCSSRGSVSISHITATTSSSLVPYGSLIQQT